MIAVLLVVTLAVLTVKVFWVIPAGIVIVATVGLATNGLELTRVTVMLPGAAARSRITVPVTVFGPVTGLGEKIEPIVSS